MSACPTPPLCASRDRRDSAPPCTCASSAGSPTSPMCLRRVQEPVCAAACPRPLRRTPTSLPVGSEAARRRNPRKGGWSSARTRGRRVRVHESARNPGAGRHTTADRGRRRCEAVRPQRAGKGQGKCARPRQGEAPPPLRAQAKPPPPPACPQPPPLSVQGAWAAHVQVASVARGARQTGEGASERGGNGALLHVRPRAPNLEKKSIVYVN